MFWKVPRAYVLQNAEFAGSVTRWSYATCSGTTTRPVQDWIRQVKSAGDVGMFRQIPGTCLGGRSYADATSSTLPRMKFGSPAGPPAPLRNVIDSTMGRVVSVYGPMWPGCSGLTTRPPSYSVRCTCPAVWRMWPRTVESVVTV